MKPHIRLSNRSDIRAKNPPSDVLLIKENALANLATRADCIRRVILYESSILILIELVSKRLAGFSKNHLSS